MSVVGPRPLLVQYLPLYNEHQARRHEVRPGFTGYAQVHGRNAITWEDKFDKDVVNAGARIGRHCIINTGADTPFAHPTIMMRKKVYDALGGYRVGHKNMRAEDLDLWIRFFEAGYKGYNIQEVLYRYHESRDDLYKRSVKVAIHTMAAFWYGYRVLNVPFYKRIWVLKPLVAALIPKWIMEKYHRIRLDKV